MTWTDFFPRNWREILEVLILWAAIYYSWIFFRGTRGAKVLTGLAVLLLAVMLLSQLFELQVIGWFFRNLSAFLVFSLVVIFQPELRRIFAALGSHRFFATATQNRETVEVLAETTFELANRQLGALIAVERDTALDTYGESGVEVDAKLTPELLVSLFFQKTPLHDGGAIVRNDRVLFAACTFPVSQRTDLERTLGMRHRAALGLCEDSDAIVIVVSEETGIVSICHRATIERNFDPESLKRRLGELLLLEKDEKVVPPPLAREDRIMPAGHHVVDGRQEEHRDDRLAF